MQIMHETCQRFASKNTLHFLTDPNPTKSKTKCICVCGQAMKTPKQVPLELDDKELPLVESILHLDHVLHESGSMDKDVKVKRH